jgi:signal-transduction protein with cAMP-binding, CBS, and nucleotidyltransferase domain
LNVSHVMKTSVVSIDSDASVKDAARKMVEHGIGSLVIVEHDAGPVGIITETDLLSRVLALGKNPEIVKVKEIMSKPLVRGDPSMDFVEAAKLMIKNKIKKLPITIDDRLVGILTMTDALGVHESVRELIEEEIDGEIPKRFMKRLMKR